MQKSRNILVVAQIRNYLLLSIEKHLQQARYQTIAVPADTDEIGKVKEPLCGMLIYVEETLLEQQQALHFLKDRAVMDAIPTELSRPLLISQNISNVEKLAGFGAKDIKV